MKKLLFVLALLLSAAYAGATACPSGYGSWYPLYILPQASTSSNQTNFPMYFTGNTTLATTGNGGKSLNSGLDVTFCTGSNSGTLINYELVTGTYVATTGAGEWWVSVPTVSYNTTETIYVGVGKSSANDANAAGVWTAYLGVWHFGTSGTLTVDGSTGNSTATNHGATAVAGEINGGSAYVSGSSEWFDTGYIQTGLTDFSSGVGQPPTATGTNPFPAFQPKFRSHMLVFSYVRMRLGDFGRPWVMWSRSLMPLLLPRQLVQHCGTFYQWLAPIHPE